MSNLSDYVILERVATSTPGVTRPVIRTVGNPPPEVAQAISNAQWMSDNLGGFGPEQLYSTIVAQYEQVKPAVPAAVVIDEPDDFPTWNPAPIANWPKTGTVVSPPPPPATPVSGASSAPAAAVATAVVAVPNNAPGSGQPAPLTPSLTVAVPNPATVVSIDDLDDDDQISAPGGTPAVALITPANTIKVGEDIEITISATDPDADLRDISLRQQGVGVIKTWQNVGGGLFRETVRVKAPATAGQVFFRGEAIDRNGHGATGAWYPVNVAGSVIHVPPPPVASTFDPTHRLVGTDVQGNPVYRIVDEAGSVIQWSTAPGAPSGAALSGTMVHLGPVESVPAYVTPTAQQPPAGIPLNNVPPLPDALQPPPSNGSAAAPGDGLIKLALMAAGYVFFR